MKLRIVTVIKMTKKLVKKFASQIFKNHSYFVVSKKLYLKVENSLKFRTDSNIVDILLYKNSVII
jgi:hypothetical protein